MQAKYLIVDQGREWEIVEKVSEEFPNIRIAIFSETLVIKAIHLSDLS